VAVVRHLIWWAWVWPEPGGVGSLSLCANIRGGFEGV
jgi:hypothetical protein